MNRPTRLVASLLTAGLLAGALAACSGGANGSGSSSTAGGPSQEVNVFYSPGSLSDSAVAGVQKAFPHAKINIVKTSFIDNKLTAALRTGKNLPSVVTADPVRYGLVASKFVDTAKYGFDAKTAAGYLDWKVSLGQVNGQQLGVPIDVGPLGFYYNEKAFAALGLPTDPKEVGKLVSTWNGYKSVSEKAKAGGKTACDNAGELLYYGNWSKGFAYYKKDGKTVVPDIDGKIGKDSFARAYDFQSNGLCANLKESSNEWSAAISRGDLIGFIQPPWIGGLALQTAAKSQSGEWRLATSTPDGYASATGSMLMVPKTATDPKLATQVAIWLTNASNQANGYVKNGLFPSSLGAYKSSVFTAPQPFYGNAPTATVLADISKKAPRLLVGPDADSLRGIFRQSLIDAVSNGKSESAAYQDGLEKATAQFGN